MAEHAEHAEQASGQAAGESRAALLLARIQANSAALQLDKCRLPLRKFKLHTLHEQLSDDKSLPSSLMVPPHAHAVSAHGRAGPTAVASRINHLQVTAHQHYVTHISLKALPTRADALSWTAVQTLPDLLHHDTHLCAVRSLMSTPTIHQSTGVWGCHGTLEQCSYSVSLKHFQPWTSCGCCLDDLRGHAQKFECKRPFINICQVLQAKHTPASCS